MSQTPAISRVLIVPGLPVPSGKSLQNVNFHAVSIGLVIDEATVVWGDYRPRSDESDVLTTLQEKIVPVLAGRPLTSLPAIMAALDELTETAVLTRPIPPAAPGSVSRRGFLTGNLTAETAVKYEEVVVERPLSAPLRYCVSQLLLTALARGQNLTVAESIAAAFNLPWQPRPVPLHLEIDAADVIPDAAVLSAHIQSLGYRIVSDDPQSQFGASGERLQRFIRQLTQLINRVTAPDYRPTIQLDVAGGLGRLFDHNIGRILGAVYGLEQAARPYSLRITNPAQPEDLAQQIKFNKQLLDYMRLRKMKTAIGVSHSIHSLVDVERFVEAQAAHWIEISPSRLGTIQQSIRAIQICQQAQIGVLLRDSTHPFASHLALAGQPDLIMVPWQANNFDDMDKIYREMTRTITFFTQIRA